MENKILSKIEKKHIVHICTRCKKVLGSTDEPLCQDCRELGEWEEAEEYSWFDLVADIRNGTW